LIAILAAIHGSENDAIMTCDARAHSLGCNVPKVRGSVVGLSLKRIPQNAAATRLRYKASALSDS
jgi:hypothetical protein